MQETGKNGLPKSRLTPEEAKRKLLVDAWKRKRRGRGLSVREETGGETLQRAVSGFGRGAVETTSLLADQAGILSGAGADALQYLGKRGKILALSRAGELLDLKKKQAHDIAKLAREASRAVFEMPSPDAEPRGGIVGSLSQDAAPALGSLVPIMASGGLSSAAGLGSVALGPITVELGAAATGFAIGSASEYMEAEAKGATEGEKWASWLAGGLVDTTEAVGIGKVMARVNKASKGRLKELLVDSIRATGQEGLQEAFSEAAHNVIAVHIRDEDRKYLEGVLDAYKGGAWSGLFVSLAGGMKGVDGRVPEGWDSVHTLTEDTPPPGWDAVGTAAPGGVTPPGWESQETATPGGVTPPGWDSVGTETPGGAEVSLLTGGDSVPLPDPTESWETVGTESPGGEILETPAHWQGGTKEAEADELTQQPFEAREAWVEDPPSQEPAPPEPREEFKLHHADEADGKVLVKVNPEAVAEALDPRSRVGDEPIKTKSDQGDRLAEFETWLKGETITVKGKPIRSKRRQGRKDGEPIIAPEASIRLTAQGRPVVEIGDGRHRFEVLRRSGSNIELALDPKSAEIARDAGLIEAAPKPKIPFDAAPAEVEPALPKDAPEAAANEKIPAKQSIIMLNAGFPPLRTLAPESLKKAWGKARPLLRTRGNLPQETQSFKETRDSNMTREMEELRLNDVKFRRAAKDAGIDLGDAQTMKELAARMHGGPKAIVRAAKKGLITEDVADALLHMRRHVDRLSRKLIRSGVLEGDVLAKVQKNVGFYLARTYRVHSDPKWAEVVPEDVRNNARAWLRKEYEARNERLKLPPPTEAQIEGELKAILSRRDKSANPIADLAAGKLGSANIDSLKKRKKIPRELRDYLGENKDPRVNYADTVARMVSLLANREFTQSTYDAGKGVYFFTEPVSNESGDFTEQISVTGTKPWFHKSQSGKLTNHPMAPLDGVYTTKEIKAAIEGDGMGLPFELSGKLLQAQSFVKLGKTVLSPMTHARNFYGNLGFSVAQGHYGANFVEGFKLARKRLKTIDSPEFRKEWFRLAELGVVRDGASAGAVRDTIEDAYSRNPGLDSFDVHNNRFQRGLKKSVERAAEWYQAGDDVWKISGFYTEKARYMRAGLDAAQAEVRAAAVVRNTFPTYSRIPEAVKAMRRFPLTGVFVSFPAEVVRTTYHTAMLAHAEIHSDNAEIRKIGWSRVMGSLAWHSTMVGVGMLSRYLVGITSEDDDDVRVFLPPWSRNSTLVYLSRDGDNFRYMDVSYADPFSYLKKPMMALARGQDPREAVKDSFLEAISPWAGEEILAGAMLDVARNTKKQGGRVYDPTSSVLDIASDITGHVWAAASPGFLTQSERVLKGARSETSKYGQKFEFWPELAAMWTGVRQSKLNIPQALRFQASTYQRNLSSSTQSLTEGLMTGGNLSEDEIRKLYETAERQNEASYQKILSAMRAADGLGVDDRTARRALTDVMGSNKARDIVRGARRPYLPGSNLMRAAINKSDPERAAELKRRLRLLRQIAKEYAREQQ